MALREFIIAHPMEPIRNVLKQQILSEYSDIHIEDMSTGGEILSAADHKIDCIFTYDELSDMHIGELVKHIRENGENAKTPIIPIISKDSYVKKSRLEEQGLLLRR